jgi:hypothetical protein
MGNGTDRNAIRCVQPSDGGRLPVQLLQAGAPCEITAADLVVDGIHLLENVKLEPMASDRVYESAFCNR